MKKLSVSLSVVIVGVVSVYALPPAAAGYGLAWSDEFDGASLDTANNWNYDTGRDYYGSAQGYYTRGCVAVCSFSTGSPVAPTARPAQCSVS